MHHLFKDPSCYKNPKKSSCIDLILTNFLNPFMETQGTCLSDFHKMTFAVLKMHFEKPKSKIVICRDNRNFCWRDFSMRHPFSMYETFSEKTENFSPSDMHMCASGGEKCQLFGTLCVRTKWTL